jgi:hypothetical protein
MSGSVRCWLCPGTGRPGAVSFFVRPGLGVNDISQESIAKKKKATIDNSVTIENTVSRVKLLPAPES